MQEFFSDDLLPVDACAKTLVASVVRRDAESVDGEATWPPRGMLPLRADGLTCLTPPHRVGGIGHRWLGSAAVTEIRAKVCASTGMCFGMHRVATGMVVTMAARQSDRFSQGGCASERGQGRLGVGLTLVHTSVALNGRAVAAQSAGLGTSSRFVVSQPLLHDADGQAEAGAAPGASTTGNPLNLMVVDDNADAAHTLAMLLEAHGYSVAVEVDPRFALNRAESLAPDVFILDIGMPHLDGYELARRIRSSTLGSSAVLIALTGYGQPEDKRRARDAGFDHHFVKPVDPVVLTDLLERLAPDPRH